MKNFWNNHLIFCWVESTGWKNPSRWSSSKKSRAIRWCKTLLPSRLSSLNKSVTPMILTKVQPILQLNDHICAPRASQIKTSFYLLSSFNLSTWTLMMVTWDPIPEKVLECFGNKKQRIEIRFTQPLLKVGPLNMWTISPSEWSTHYKFFTPKPTPTTIEIWQIWRHLRWLKLAPEKLSRKLWAWISPRNQRFVSQKWLLEDALTPNIVLCCLMLSWPTMCTMTELPIHKACLRKSIYTWIASTAQVV